LSGLLSAQERPVARAGLVTRAGRSDRSPASRTLSGRAEDQPRHAGSVPHVGRRGEAGVDRGIRRRFRDGDPDAVRLVYRAYGRLVYAVSYRVLRDAGLAEEATQQTFLKAWRAAESLDQNREMAPWLATIARRVAIDVQRGEVRRTAYPLESVAPADPALVSEPRSAEELHGVWEVRRALDELPPDEREVVRLQHFEGLTHTEIAERLQVPAGTVKSRSFRAHKRLATKLTQERE
jgi:RNA polymerase sigma factor (sigma-70 family)